TFAFRGPFEMAKITATVDELSAGRIEVGLGAGWHAPEHLPLGLPFGALGERFERLEEQLTVLPRLWIGEEVSHSGRHYRLDGAVSLPRPVQYPGPPIIVGGKGRPRGLRLAVEHAAEYDLDTVGPDVCADVGRRLDAACAAAGRPRGSIVLSVMTPPADGSGPLRRQLEAYAAAGIERIVLDLGTAPIGADVDGLAASLRASIGWSGASAVSR
ncbi:MAG: Luciferase-like monooxygenase, partial [Chloroflexi bacterium]|nr:Luciferase-like monooxygenase [Chloroflexota bacterium]